MTSDTTDYAVLCERLIVLGALLPSNTCEQAKDAIEALLAREAALFKDCCELKQLAVDASAAYAVTEQRRAALEAECDALRKDAERYLWLRDVASHARATTILNDSAENIDYAIDALIAELAKGKANE